MVEIPETARYALVVEGDLFFSVPIEKTLSRLGYTPHVATTLEEARALAEGNAVAVAIVSFNADRFSPEEVVRCLKAISPAPVLGYVSHKWMPQVRPNAMAAGCDLLVANSALILRLPELLQKLTASQHT